ncbi:LysR family transcriptional regulator [uncultured Ralstonia sp.]|jgi:DNA-binding transcriptional LysR family regulator|uniref:LysR family transcriptional regulator n=1 Tax=Ralstonia sp. TaxID=54061 RepID=UPI0025E6CFCD|nr:LysR family transcriptional regulator [uncultured Ralstonia sp.]
MLRELKTFIAVARHGTFAGAGERIGLTQSAVSAQIQRLEESLGFQLFDRTGRSATLNAAGHDALALAEHIVALYDKLGEQGGSSEQRGMVRVGAIASVQSTFLADALVRFRAEFPHCRARILPGVSLDLLGLVDAGEIDVAVLIRPPFAVPADLEWRTLVAEPFVLLAPASLPGDDWRALLATVPFIRYDRRSFGGRRVDQFLRDQHISVHEAIELDELQGMAQLVARGQGIALAPQTFGQGPWPAGVRAIGLGDDTFFREIGLVERPRHSRQPIAGRLAECIDEAARYCTT